MAAYCGKGNAQGHHAVQSLSGNIEGITPKVLTERLRELQKLGIVRRRIVSDYPIRVEYGLTDLGKEFEPMLLAGASFSM